MTYTECEPSEPPNHRTVRTEPCEPNRANRTVRTEPCEPNRTGTEPSITKVRLSQTEPNRTVATLTVPNCLGLRALWISDIVLWDRFQGFRGLLGLLNLRFPE